LSSTRKSNRTPGAPSTITSIPLSDAHPNGPSVGELVKDATAQMSTLVRAEVELAKTELWGELKKLLVGSIFFIVALVVALLSTGFFAFFLVTLVHIWLPWWASALVIFLFLIFLSLVALGLGVWRVIKIRPPRKTIDSLKQAADVLPAVTMPSLSPKSTRLPAEDGDYRTGSFVAPIKD
jgi:uncharacterized membrane protein YqjE